MALGAPFVEAVAGKPPVFADILIPHIVAGGTALMTGVLVMLARRRNRWRARVEAVYLAAVAGLVVTAAGLTLVAGIRDLPVFLLGILTLALAGAGPLSRRRPGAGPWRDGPADGPHTLAMPASYAVMWTAFLVDNARFLPLVARLPTALAVALPAVVATPLLGRALLRHRPPRTRAVHPDQAG